MKKSKTQRGITLIALVITIVILLILAIVAINSIQNAKIFMHAQNAANKWNTAVAYEKNAIEEYEKFLNNYIGGSSSSGSGTGGGTTIPTVETVKNEIISTTSNTEVQDEYGNKIVVPAGFKIRVDSTTNNADTVTEGIVIEDDTGNQFVWIPTGTVYTDNTAQKETTAKTITLGRYSSFTLTNGAYTPAQTIENYKTSVYISSCTEDTAATHVDKDNAIARNIGHFVTSATTKGGYYIGRYEAGDSSNNAVANRTGTYGTSTTGTLVCKANQVPYNWITQLDASTKCKSMYADGYKSDGTETFSSDLINSYAWDTAIIFIQTFGTKSNSSTYASTVGKSTNTSTIKKTGTDILNATNAVDEQLNIYDMAGNCCELSTETIHIDSGPCTGRGGIYVDSAHGTGERVIYGVDSTMSGLGFRPVLYVG